MNYYLKIAHKFSIIAYALFLSACMMNASIEPLTSNSTIRSDVKIAKKIYLDTTHVTMSEGSVAIINVALDEKYDSDIHVNIDLNDPNNRFQPIASSITIPAQSISKSIILQSIDDSIYQGVQSISLSISSQDANIIADPNNLDITLTDNDAPPAITIADASANENASSIKFSVSLNRQSILPTTLTYSTVNGTALSGSDYTAVSNAQLTIPAGQTTGEISINLINDSSSEANETFTLSLTNPVNGTLQNSSATGTIVDDDAVPFISFNTTSQTVNENVGTIQVQVSLDSASSQSITLPFTLSGTATSSADYTLNTVSPLVIPAGQITANISITINDDALNEANETVILTMGAPTNAAFGTNTIHTITIQDNDTQPSVQFASVSQSVNESTATVTATINLSAASGQSVQVPFTLSGTATGGSVDYLATTSSPVTIPAGSTSATISFSIINDTSVESDETIIVSLGAPTNASLGASTTHTITIVDDDVYISINDVTVSENAGTATFTISLSKISPLDVQVTWATANGTAIAGTNYTSSSASINIPTGTTTKTISVPIIDTPATCEGTRTFYVNLSSPNNGTIQDNQGVGFITENDYPSISIGNAAIGEAYIASVPISLAQTCNVDITVNYSTTDNTATAGLDYLGASNLTATIPAGSLSAYIPILIFNDSISELNETFTVTISSPNYGSISTASATVTIQDDDYSRITPTNFTQVSVGGYHTCAVNSIGEIKCWGRNNYGQVGSGAVSIFEEIPITVAVGGVATKVSSGGTQSSPGFTCAVVGGGAKCWGRNDYGQLGNGNTTQQLTPVQVSGLTANVTDIATGGFFSCALVNGGVKCWGRNNYGQLGNNSTTDSTTPVDVSGLTSNVSSISVGQNSACAIISDGTIKCWGRNQNGQLGNNSTTDSLVPLSVSGIASGATSVSIAYGHACAVVSGNGYCWGSNSYGQLGDGSYLTSLVPIAVNGLTNASQVFVTGDDYQGYHTSCTIQSNGTSYCWGINSARQFGTISVSLSNTKILNPNFASSITSLSLSPINTCAVVSGVLKCWGSDYYANFARTGHRYNLKPIDAALPLTVSQISIGGYRSSCAVIAGAAKCWGNNSNGQLGNSTYTSSSTPVTVTGLSSGITKVSMSGQGGDGNSHACALTSSGALYCWGSNGYGQLGDGTTTTRNSPYQVFSSGVIDFEVAYGNHTCAIMTGGALKCWGRNDYGQLGDGTTTQSTIPVNTSGLSSGVTLVTASRTHTCAIVSGGLKCWGTNVKGELGQGSTGPAQLIPIDVPGMTSGVSFASATGLINSEKTCAVVNGSAKCWGYGYGGALGDGTALDRYSPTQVTGLTSGVSKVKVNDTEACALMSNGSLKCWGTNSNGEVGSGNLNQYNSPTSVIGFSSGVVDFDLGYYNACVLTVGNGVKCWGNNYEGILGLGYSTETELPIDIQFLPPSS